MVRKKKNVKEQMARSKIEAATCRIRDVDPECHKWLQSCRIVMSRSETPKTIQAYPHTIEANTDFVFDTMNNDLPWILMHEWAHLKLQHSRRMKQLFYDIIHRGIELFSLAAEIEANEYVAAKAGDKIARPDKILLKTSTSTFESTAEETFANLLKVVVTGKQHAVKYR